MEDFALEMGSLRERYPDLLAAIGGEAVYDERVAEASDVVLVVETADTTLKKYRDEKVPEYAAADISECWLMGVHSRQLRVYRDPDPSPEDTGRWTGSGRMTGFWTAPGRGTLVPVADRLPLR